MEMSDLVRPMNNQQKIAVLLYCLAFSLLSFASGCLEAERRALLDFKSLLMDPSNRLTSWQGQDCCRWKGIKCSNIGNVISLDLRNPNPENFMIDMNSELISASSNFTKSTALEGTVSPSLFILNQLGYVDLSFNNFKYSKLPSGLSNLTRLTYLNLSNAVFVDFITTQFANLSSLTQLDISCSKEIFDASTISINLTTSKITSGSSSSYIPNCNLYSSNLNWLLGLANLKELRLTGIDLSDASQSTSWAEPISFIYKLRHLDLSNCSISGKIPVDQFLNLTLLSSLIMNSNYISSHIPYQLANITSLTMLDLKSSNLQDSIPYLPQLKVLYVGYNYGLIIDLSLMFSVPWSHLEELDIQHAQVAGSIPSLLANTTSLVSFIARNCSIQGSIPLSVTNLSRLEKLELSNNNIGGDLSPSLSNMRNLQFLSLSQNVVSGSIPKTICDMHSLKYLNLNHNRLTGIFPECISYLPNLIVLGISRNYLSGSVRISSLQSSNLVSMFLGYNGLTVMIDNSSSSLAFHLELLELRSCNIGGVIPAFIFNLTRLAYLDLANNSLSGPIPSWLFNLPSLSFLDLSSNNLQGSIPLHIRLHFSIYPRSLNLANNKLQGSLPSHLENVEVIILSGNRFSGHLPTEIGELVNIRYISFSRNRLYGQIPVSFFKGVNSLEVLDLSNNSLSGKIPISLGNCTSLVFLSLGENNLDGNIPLELQGAYNLQYLYLSGNDLNGTFPNVIRTFQSLTDLNLANNRLEGRIPEFIGGLHNLRILELRSNKLNGSIPQEILQLKKLQYIGLSNNSLSGHIPNEFGGLKMLIDRPVDGSIRGFLSSLMFVGAELDIVAKGSHYQLESVYTYNSGIDISGNTLTGSIPKEIGLLGGLYMLNLSHNQLSGEIPKTIGEMKGLESLDLSFNTLTGEIPQTLTSLDFLGVLNLSYNNLSGTIPAAPHIDTLDRSGFQGNQFLCGAPDVKISCGNIESPSPRTKTEASDAEEKLIFIGIVMIGYGFGFSFFFLALYMMTAKWRKRYYRFTDNIVLRMIQFLDGDRMRVFVSG